MAAGIAGEPTAGPVLVFLDCAAGTEALPVRAIGTEVLVAPVSGSIDVGGTILAQGDVRLEEADVEHAAAVAGPEGVQLVVLVADRRALAAALDAGAVPGALGGALADVLPRLLGDLANAAA
jgi:hypothetical protein